MARSVTDALRRLGLRPAGGNPASLRRRIERLGLSTAHFDPAARPGRPRGTQIPLEDVLVERSTYKREILKRRLYDSGLKSRKCELCGQGEEWRGRRMSLILDHVNGVPDDNRLENLRIVCPNCNATLDTHCGRNARLAREDRSCLRCGRRFSPRSARQRYCSRACGSRWDRSSRPQSTAREALRRADRPSSSTSRSSCSSGGRSLTLRAPGRGPERSYRTPHSREQ